MATILVVEDNQINRKLATLLLETAGHTVLQAEDGASGLNAARTHLPDLVLMDVQMPDMDGLAVTEILKSESATASIPIIALTAHAMEGDEEKSIAAGCDGYIAKPFHYQEFFAAVDTALHRSTAQ
jgi:two-component system cell cycle response regulator DivK